jgi:choline dehydrogenase-like flavoprotein
MNLARMKTYALDDVVDAVVIGTGAGASPIIARLAGAGLHVVALEAGKNTTPEDYPADEIAASGIYWLGERLSAGDTPNVFGSNNSGMGVGGSTLHWGAFCPRVDPRDLRMRTEQGAGEDWPLTYDDLKPYYEEVEAFIGVSGPLPYPWDPARMYPLPPVARNAPAELFTRACDMHGVRVADGPVAVVSRNFVQDDAFVRPACINCGYCHQGCRIGAKTSMDVTYLPFAVRMGAEIRPECVAIDFERDAHGRICAVIYRDGGTERRQRCAAVFLCAGAVESPRLLLNHDLANSSGAVGRNYMAHVATQVWGTFERETRPNKGYPSAMISEDMLRPKDADFVGGYVVQSLGIVPLTFAHNVTRGRGLWGEALVDYLDRYNHVAGVGINGECLPDPSNALTLCDERDEHGLRKARVTFSAHANERRMKAHAEKLMTQMWESIGATDIWTLDRYAHTIGTCRMGTDAASAVVDHAGKSFDIDNLWICDNSVFPSSLAANPALTIMALGLRTADHFLRERG